MAVGNRVFLKRAHAKPGTVGWLCRAARGKHCRYHGALLRHESQNQAYERLSGDHGGSALTVKARAGDNLFLHQALDMAQPGDIIVVSNDEDQTRSLMGEIMFTYAKYQRKLGGLVLDGPIRDVDAVRQMDLPVYANGSTPGGPHKEGPGEINVPIACGGVSVNPGDIIVADADGIIVIPLKDAPAVLEAAKKFHQQDEAKVEAAKNGTSKPMPWVMKDPAGKEILSLLMERMENKNYQMAFK